MKVSLTVNKPRHEVYAFWRKIENFPLFMKHLKDITVLDPSRSRWELSVLGDTLPVKWESEIVLDEQNERIGWQSKEGTIIENAGNIHFEDAGKFGTEVHAVISYRAPGGKITEAIAGLFNPLFENMIREDIKNFKRFIESGVLPTIENQPFGD
ncbi:SRPBCC family protein [Albibacterium profundi]|uniref:SRPBCC family protein n=1 Tax=Albibacterium profundi TaxID=3134906 RepID=A0ABV5CHL6_9SPHI